MTQTSTISRPALITVPMADTSMDIEYQWINPELTTADLIIFLHEGLGSISMWRDWPAQLCQAAQCRGLVYSRYGYGQSTPRSADKLRNIDYLHIEAQQALPAFLQAMGLQDQRPILFGHSDGGSIALIYAASHPDAVKAIMVAAPHIFVEDITLEGIVAARELASTTDLIEKLGRHHRNPSTVFSSWNDTWLTDQFRDWNIEALLPQIQCPLLAIQGDNDEYGTLEQIQGIKRLAPQTQLCILPDCGHSPHREQATALNVAITDFLKNIS
ncbi:alpha/beta hydrolase [Alcaligenaceae bacterium]|nr:alpha/beta hydrolase [Alcaligenaceae bacterium]